MKQQGENPTDNQLGAGLSARAAAVAVNDSLLENTSVASDEGGTFASSMIIWWLVCRPLTRHYTDCVFNKLAEWAGLTRRLDLLFLLHQGKRKLNNQNFTFLVESSSSEVKLIFLVLFLDEKYQKSNTNNAIPALCKTSGDPGKECIAQYIYWSKKEAFSGIALYKQSRPGRSALPDFQLFLHSPCRRPAVHVGHRTQPIKSTTHSTEVIYCISFYPACTCSCYFRTNVMKQQGENPTDNQLGAGLPAIDRQGLGAKELQELIQNNNNLSVILS